MVKGLPLLLLVLCAHMPGNCGPSDEEAARAVMFAAPFAFAVGMGLMRLMLWLWRKRRPELAAAWKPSGVALATLAVVLVLSFLGVSENACVWEWYWVAFVLMGSSYLAVLLVTWRIWLWISPRTAFTWAFLPAIVLMMWPCPFMLSSTALDWDAVSVVFWIFPGYVGIVPGGLLVLLVSEILLRIRQSTKSSS